MGLSVPSHARPWLNHADFFLFSYRGRKLSIDYGDLTKAKSPLERENLKKKILLKAFSAFAEKLLDEKDDVINKVLKEKIEAEKTASQVIRESRGFYELINDMGKANQKYAAENRKLKSRNQKLERELEITRNKLKLKEAQTEHVKIVTSKPNPALSTKKPSEEKYVT